LFGLQERDKDADTVDHGDSIYEESIIPFSPSDDELSKHHGPSCLPTTSALKNISKKLCSMHSQSLAMFVCIFQRPPMLEMPDDAPMLLLCNIM
jgi:hypothetical protein